MMEGLTNFYKLIDEVGPLFCKDYLKLFVNTARSPQQQKEKMEQTLVVRPLYNWFSFGNEFRENFWLFLYLHN